MKSIICLFLILAGLSLSTDSYSQERQYNFKERLTLPFYRFRKMNNSDLFQGNREQKDYFEGWYFKMVSADSSSILSIIPGISLSENGEEQEAFIQIINGKTAQTSYYKYPIESFSFAEYRFAVQIGDNFFSEDSINIHIENDTTSIHGNVYMSNQVKMAKNKGKKDAGIMGWYRYVPLMECYHGVVSLNHDLKGNLQLNKESYNFDNGLGYIEKDWGKSMPSSWIWMQTNNFSKKNTSFMLSVAEIPWLGSSFTGFLGFVLYDGVPIRFGTYTNAKLHIENSENNKLKITVVNKKKNILIEASRKSFGLLMAPVHGSMDRRIAEGIDAQLKLTISNKEGGIIFQDSSAITGLEMVGNIENLKAGLNKKN
jgi:tocopherol cyclase